MISLKFAVGLFLFFFPSNSKKILAYAFRLPSFRVCTYLPGSSTGQLFLRNSIIEDDIENSGIITSQGFSIFLADSRDKVFDIKLYRFGGPSVEEHMESNPHLSRQDALQSLTPHIEDDGTQKVFYGNGITGESVQFYALADNLYSVGTTKEQDLGNSQMSQLQSHGVIGSVEAVCGCARKENRPEQVSIELKNLSVHPIARRRGIGKALTEAVQEHARQQVSILEQKENKKFEGIVHLIVESDNKGAMKLYEEAGFVLTHSTANEPLCKLTWSTEGTYT